MLWQTAPRHLRWYWMRQYLPIQPIAAKIRQMFAAMKDDGVPASVLEPVRAPVGLSIGSHTPEEIAVSIAAEIVAVRNGRS